jgi:hypothetical protein
LAQNKPQETTVVNVFEGGRRVALVLAGAWILGWAGYGANHALAEHTVSLTFAGSPASADPWSSDPLVDPCDPTELSYKVQRDVPGGTLDLGLCFKTAGDKLVVVHEQPNFKEVDLPRGTPGTNAYLAALAENFKVPSGLVSKEMQKERNQDWDNALVPMLAGLLAEALVVTAVGWIVRGLNWNPARTRRSSAPVTGLEVLVANRGVLVCVVSAAVALLLWGLLPGHPYAYFMLLRVVVCFTAAFCAVAAYRAGSEGWTWVLGGTGALYNPFLRVYLTRDIWWVVNVLTIALMVIACVVLARPISRTNPAQRVRSASE